MIAGGIGITPYRSRIKYIVDKGLNIPIQVLYANTTQEQITFKKQLDEISSTHPNIKITHFVGKHINAQEISQMENGKWKMENIIYWVCGPPAMVTSMEEILINMGIAQDKIRTEKFTGY